MSVPLQLHPKLLYNPVNPGLPVLEWDLALSPPTALSVTGRHCYVKPDLTASAVSPDVQTIHIESDEPLLQGWMQRWGPIIVNNDDKVTMGDVMWTIYDYLQKPLTNEDKELIKERDRKSAEGTSDWHSLEYARHIRCQEGYGLYRVASREDFKRVDALGGLRRFKGCMSCFPYLPKVFLALTDLFLSAICGLWDKPMEGLFGIVRRALICG
jgi:hypothetical protein